MKKVLFTVALLVIGTFAYAQVSVIKEAKSLKNDPEKAAIAILPALTDPETANNPETWKMAGDFQKAIYDSENMKLFLPNQTADTTKLYNSLVNMFEYYLKADKVEQAAVQSGALKKAKLHKKLAEELKKVRINLVNGGADAYNKGDYQSALKYFGMFVDTGEDPLFAEDTAVKNDTLNALYANYAVLAAQMLNDKDDVMKYGAIGKNDKEEGYRSLMFLAEAYGDRETGDSTKWLETIKEGFQRFPKQDYFVGNLMDNYIRKGQIDEGLNQIDQLLAQQGETSYLLYVKGVLQYEKKDYSNAESTFNKIIALDKELLPEANAKIGDCYFFPAQAIVEENSKIAIDDPNYNANEAKIKDLYEKALPHYLKAKELAPDKKQLWGNYLLNIYWKLNKSEYDALSKELDI